MRIHACMGASSTVWADGRGRQLKDYLCRMNCNARERGGVIGGWAKKPIAGAALNRMQESGGTLGASAGSAWPSWHVQGTGGRLKGVGAQGASSTNAVRSKTSLAGQCTADWLAVTLVHSSQNKTALDRNNWEVQNGGGRWKRGERRTRTRARIPVGIQV